MRATSPALTLTRPSVPDAEDYFSSRPVQRQPFNRAATDTFAETMTAMRRGSPFNNNGPAVMELPRFSPGLPDAVSPTDRRAAQGNSYAKMMQAWHAVPTRQRAGVLQCASLTLMGLTAVSAGFVFGLWVALNHLDLSGRQGKI